MNIQALTTKTKPIADRVIKDAVMLGNWEIVNDKRASEITHRDNDDEPLHGLLFKAYEMKWNEVNTNGEMYDQAAFDDFIENYFVGRKFNMPVTVEHSNDPQWVVGRVLYIERNSVGFYFVCYIPDTCPNYNTVKWMSEQGLLQGLSKEGYITDGEWRETENGDDWYLYIKKLMMTRVSLVCTPANGVKFEKAQEIKNALSYKKPKKESSVIDTLIKH